MHKLISRDEALMTRFLTLKNLETGTVDECFDYSDIVNSDYRNFCFMEDGKNYSCKIELFGDVRQGRACTKVLCRVLRENVTVGKRRRAEVSVGKDIYYIPQSDVDSLKGKDVFYYYYTRKDLIQVDDVIHGDYLRR